jgi:hypothetical protein
MCLAWRLQFNSAALDLQGISRFELLLTENRELGTSQFSTRHNHPKPTVHYNE